MWIRFFSDDELEGIGFQVQYRFTAGQPQNELVPAVERFKFLGNTISFSPKWNPIVTHVVQKAQQQLSKMSKAGMLYFYRAEIMIAVRVFSPFLSWCGSPSADGRKALATVIKAALKIIGQDVSSQCEIYSTACQGWARK